MNEQPIGDSIFDQIKAAIDHAERTERELRDQERRNSHLETVLKIMARRNGGKLTWKPRELDDAREDERCVIIGALDMELYGSHSMNIVMRKQNPTSNSHERH